MRGMGERSPILGNGPRTVPEDWLLIADPVTAAPLVERLTTAQLTALGS